MRHPRGGRASQCVILEEAAVLKASYIISRCKAQRVKLRGPLDEKVLYQNEMVFLS